MHRLFFLLAILFLFPLSLLKAGSLLILPPLKGNPSPHAIQTLEEKASDDSQKEEAKEPEDSIDIYQTEDGTKVTDIRTNQGRTAYKKIESPDGDILVNNSAQSRKPQRLPNQHIYFRGDAPYPAQPDKPDPQPPEENPEEEED